VLPVLGDLIGEASCVGAALCWAVAVILFRPGIARYGAPAVNLAKCTIATVLLGLTTLALGQVTDLRAAPAAAVAWIAVSGLVGMTIGDTALFASVNRLGVHRALLLQTLAPLCTAALARLAYGEHLVPAQALGGVVVLGGVALVILQQRPARERGGPAALLPGVLLGVLGAVGQGSGVVLAKIGMAELPFLAASFVRLATATVGLLAVLAASGRSADIARVLGTGLAYRALLVPSVLGTYVAILLMMAGIAFAPASVAAVLLSLPPVFSLFIEARVSGTPITLRGLVGTALAVGGVALIVSAG